LGRVSREYSLIQHEDLLDSLLPVFAAEGHDLDSMHGELITTDVGERIVLSVELPMYGTTPSDGFPLACRLRCLNSVDASTALEAELPWFRQICSNGMFGWRGEPIRRVHRFGNVLESMQRRLVQRFRDLHGDQSYFSHLMNVAVSAGSLIDLLDVFVARRWSRSEAARAYHICTTGKDGHVICEDAEAMPHELIIHSTIHVPGACAPVRNLYHVGQALSWIAGQSMPLERRFSRMATIPELLRHLLN